ncbi:hypothetical protein [Alkalibacillus haloalkaliphilus]|uniref:hypothetical protein n=1 Tax=Alkalibacillus haloalkaliphilus TaxID=94136 RepID=UPI001C3FB206|nr:hypothetical protein [Alkalibacillus haloalkaliphilus]
MGFLERILKFHVEIVSLGDKMKNLDEIIKSSKDDIENVGDFLPYIGSLFRAFKMKQFNKRLAKNENRIKGIYSVIPSESFEYFGIKIGTSVIQNILLDDEDEKTEYLLLGFENTVRNGFTDYDVTLLYFDLICELRSADLKRLVDLSHRNGQAPLVPIEDSSEQTFLSYIDRKLENKNLILRERTWGGLGGEYVENTDLSTVKITDLGNKLLDFISY